jgi:hypothetical protein
MNNGCRYSKAHASHKGICVIVFEEAVLLSLTRLFRDGKPLSDVFKFVGKESDPEKNVPDWAHQKGYTVSQNPEAELVVADIVNGNPVLPSAGVAYSAKNPNDVRRWITSKRTLWCIPGQFMGPDLLMWLRLDDGRLLLVLIQAKCYLTGNIDTLVPQVTSQAIQSLNTNKLHSGSESVCYAVVFFFLPAY